jgi:hypothetical protein
VSKTYQLEKTEQGKRRRREAEGKSRRNVSKDLTSKTEEGRKVKGS